MHEDYLFIIFIVKKGKVSKDCLFQKGFTVIKSIEIL